MFHLQKGNKRRSVSLCITDSCAPNPYLALLGMLCRGEDRPYSDGETASQAPDNDPDKNLGRQKRHPSLLHKLRHGCRAFLVFRFLRYYIL